MQVEIEGGRFLIVGGASLVGSHCVRAFLEAGANEVIVLDPVAFDHGDSLGELKDDARVSLVPGDIRNLHELVEAAEGIDGAINLAAFMSLPLSRDPWTAIDVNVRGMQNVLEAARIRGVKKVLFASSSAIYGYGIGGEITEELPLSSHGVPPAAVIYGCTKLIGEQLCRHYHKTFGLDFVALRYSTVYGEGQHYRAANALYIIEAYDRIRRGERPVIVGDGSEAKDYVYAGDVARANLLAMSRPVSNVALNISGGEGITVKALTELIIRLSGADMEPEYRGNDGAVRLKTAADLRYVNAKAKEVLGWEPQVSMEDGIRRLIAWRDANPPG